MNNRHFFLCLFVFLLVWALNVDGQKPVLKINSGHSCAITSIVYSSNGKYLLTASYDQTAKIWEAKTGRVVFSLENFHGSMFKAIFSPDEKYILTIGSDTVAKIWESASGKLLCNLIGHTTSIADAEFSKNGEYITTAGRDDNTVKIWKNTTGELLYNIKGFYIAKLSRNGQSIITAGMDNVFKIWDSSTGQIIHSFPGINDSITSLEFSPDGQSIVCVTNKNDICILKSQNGMLQSTIKYKFNSVRSVKYSPDGKYIAILDIGSDSNTIVFESSSGKFLQKFKGKTPSGKWVCFSPDGHYLAIPDNNIVNLWNLKTGCLHTVLSDHSGFISSFAFSPNSNFIVTAGSDNIMNIWETGSGKKNMVLKGHIAPSTSYILDDYSGDLKFLLRLPRYSSFINDGKNIWTTSDNSMANIWDLVSGKIANTLFWYKTDFSVTVVSPDGRFIAWFNQDSTISICDIISGKLINKINGGTRKINSIEFSPDGNLLLTVGIEMKIWETISGKLIRNIIPHDSEIFSAKFSPSGKTILTSGNGKIIELWEVNSGKLLHSISTPKGFSYSTEFSPDGKYIAATCLDSTIKIWLSDSGKQLHSLHGHNDQVQSIIFSPDEKHILSGSYDGTAKLWDYLTGKLINSFDGYNCLGNFSPDGKNALIENSNHMINIWNLSTKKLITSLIGHTDRVYSANYSSNGKFILTSSSDNTTKIWNAETGQEIVSLIALDSTEWIAISPSGLFDASPRAMKLMYYVVNNSFNKESPWTLIEIDQLKHRYYQPGLLPILLGYSNEKLRQIPPFDNVSLFPSTDLRIENDQLAIHLKNQGGGIGRVSVYIENIQIKEDARVDQGGSKNEMTVTIDLSKYSGFFKQDTTNVIGVVAWNSEGYLSSNIDTVRYIPPINKKGVGIVQSLNKVETPRPHLYGLIVGISDYGGNQIDLRYGAIDAEAFSNALTLCATRLFGKENVHIQTLVTGNKEVEKEEPSNVNILTQFGKLTTVKPEDIIVVYFSGHGVNYGGQDGLFYYLTMEADGTDALHLNDPVFRKYKALSSQDIATCLNQIPARKKVLIIDACSSGQAADNLLASLSKEIPSSQKRALEFTRDATGSYVLASSAANAVSYETGIYGHGLLTYSLLKGMRGAQLNRIEEGDFVDVEQLFQYAKTEVPILAKDISGIQEPIIKTPGTSGRLIIGQMTEEDKKKIEIQEPKAIFIPCQFSNTNEDPEAEEIDLAEKINIKLDQISANEQNNDIQFTRIGKFPDAYMIKGKYTIRKQNIEIKYVLKFGNQTVGNQYMEFGNLNELEPLLDALIKKIRNTININSGRKMNDQ